MWALQINKLTNKNGHKQMRVLFQLALKKLKSKDNLQNASQKVLSIASVIQRCPNLFQTENTKVLAM